MVAIHSLNGQGLNGCSDIELDNGMFAVVDNEDAEKVSQYKWYAHDAKGLWYAIGHEQIKRGKWKTIQMHRLILNPPRPLVVDHINRNGLDNRKCNLRIASISQNHANRIKTKNCTSIYKGVWWNKTKKRWAAQVGHKHKKIRLGLFLKEMDAAIAYDRALYEIYGEYARLNFPHIHPETFTDDQDDAMTSKKTSQPSVSETPSDAEGFSFYFDSMLSFFDRKSDSGKSTFQTVDQ